MRTNSVELIVEICAGCFIAIERIITNNERMYKRIELDYLISSDINISFNIRRDTMGRGGLGTSEAGYNRINTAYENARNAAIKSGNEQTDEDLKAYEQFIKDTRVTAGKYEGAARDNHGDYVLDGLNRYLTGDENSAGMLDALGSGVINYNNGAEDISVNGFLNANDEKKLREYVDNVRNENSYFYGGDGKQDADTIFQQYYDLIAGKGSQNAKYQDYLKWDKAEKEKFEATKPDNYAKRGAIGRAANYQTTKSASSPYMSGGINDFVLNFYRGLTNIAGSVAVNNQRYTVKDVKRSIHNKLLEDYPHALENDIVKNDGIYYVKIGKGFCEIKGLKSL